MRLRDRLRLLARIAFARSGASDWIAQAFATGADTLTVRQSVTRPFLQHPSVHRAMRAFSQNIARIPLEFFRPGTDEVIDDHPIKRLFSRPWPTMRGTQLLEATSLDLDHWGNALWWHGEAERVSLRADMIPIFIRRLPPDRTKIVLDDADVPIGYQVSTNKGQITIPAQEVVHYKFWNPYCPEWGASWLEAARAEYEGDWLASIHNRNFFRRGGTVDGVLTPREGFNISDPVAERVRTAWEQRHMGVERAHSIAILPTGLQYEKTGIGQREMDFPNLRRVARENTLSSSGVPPGVAGIMEFANYANLQPQLRIWMEFDVLPRVNYIEAVLQADFLDKLKIPLEVHFKTEVLNALLEDLDMKSTVAQKWWQMGVPLSQINDRLELGLDLDGVDGADEAFISFGVQPAGMVAEPEEEEPLPAPPPPPAPEEEPEDEPPEEEPEDEPQAEGEDKVVNISGGVARSEIRRVIVWRALQRAPRSLYSAAQSRWRTHLKRLQVEVLKNLGSLAHEEQKALRVEKQRVVDPIDYERVLFSLESASGEAKVLMEPVWVQAMARGSKTVAIQSGISVGFDIFDPAIQKAIIARRVRIVRTTERMRNSLREWIAEGAERGLSEEMMRQRVLDFFAGERRNARTIARTEVSSPFNEARFATMQRVGIKRHEWLTSRDPYVREDSPNMPGKGHRGLDGESVRIGEPFSNGLLHPQDPSGPAGEVINCRCNAVPAGSIIEGDVTEDAI